MFSTQQRLKRLTHQQLCLDLLYSRRPALSGIQILSARQAYHNSVKNLILISYSEVFYLLFKFKEKRKLLNLAL